MRASARTRPPARRVPAGYSPAAGKRWAARRLADIHPAAVLDVGPGAGTWARMLARLDPATAVYGVEVCEAYVVRFDLEALYDDVLVADARTADLGAVDVVILGDVLDRMPVADAAVLWTRARAAARTAVLASLTVAGHPGDADDDDDNPHGRRVAAWTHGQALAVLGGVAEHTLDAGVGVYLAPGRRPARTPTRGGPGR